MGEPSTPPPIAWNIISNNYEPLAVQLEDVDRDIKGSPFQMCVAGIKELEEDAPSTYSYDTVRVFSYNKRQMLWEAKDKAGRVNAMPLEVFLQHPDIQPLLTNDKIVNGLNFLDKRIGGNVIDFDTANENNKNYDPANAPVLQLLGTRTFTPATPTTDKGKGKKRSLE
jgi:hypothetical protein